MLGKHINFYYDLIPKEEYIIDNEAVFESFFQNIPIAFYWMNRNGMLLGCNQVELDMLELSSPKQFIGKHADELSNRLAWENSKKIMETNNPQMLEEFYTKSNGEKFHCLSVKKPIYNREGNVVGLLGIAIDITDRKKAEEELKVAKEHSRRSE